MTRDATRMDDATFDRALAGALRREADRIAAAQPPARVALARLAPAVDDRGRGRVLGARATAVAWLALLLLAGVALVVVGSRLWLEDRPNPIVLGGIGPRSQCDAPLADGMPIEAFRDEAVLMVDSSGLVTHLSGDPGDSPPADEGPYRTRMESRFVTGVLTPAGTSMVIERILALGLDPGCYTMRTRAGDSMIWANTPGGPLGLHFSWGNGIGSVAPLLGVAEEERLAELLDALFELGQWLPADAFTPLEPAELDAWIVHTTFRPAGAGAPASDVAAYESVRLPGGVPVAEFGDAIPGASDEGTVLIAGFVDVRTANQRCGIVNRSQALALADSLDPFALESQDGAGPDLYTPDGATAITIRLHPAVGAHSTCVGFATSINSYNELGPPPAVPSQAPVGDLAAMDPCSFVPGDLRGPVEAVGFPRGPRSPFGLAAPSCVLEWRHSMTTGGAERVLWLYPESVSEDEARSLSALIFGSATASSFRGAPLWLNHCLAEEQPWIECRWAVAGLSNGRYFVLEVSDPDATVDGLVAALGRILTASP